MRVPLIAGNWKMHTTLKQALNLVQELKSGLEEIEGVEKVICPPFISLAAVKEALGDSAIGLGAQNMHYEEQGAFTGEVSPLMLKDLCQYVILGHSERRRYFGEDDALINRKVLAAFKFGLKPIMCVGETLEERDAGKTQEVVERQVREGLKGVTDPDGLVIAYEPVWAIGTGRAASGDDAMAVIGLIRGILRELWGAKADEIRILYGGSVTGENIDQFVRYPDIDGALVGGASLKAQEFQTIVARTAALRRG